MRLADLANDLALAENLVPSERDEKGRFLRFAGEDEGLLKAWLFGRGRESARSAVEDVPF
jgi:hypothetical protein